VRLAACARAAKLRGLHRELRRADGASVRLIIDRPYSIVDRAINPATWIKLQFSTGTLTLAFGKTQWPALASAACVDDRDQRNALCGLLLAEALPQLAAFDWQADVASAADSASSSASASMPTGIALAQDGRRIDLLDADDHLLDVIEHHFARRPIVSCELPRGVSLRCRAVIGERRLSRGRLASLVEGDAVLFSAQADVLVVAGTLYWGSRRRTHLRAPCIFRAAQMTIENAPALSGHESIFQGDSIADDSGAADVVDIGQLEVPIQFELEGPILTLAEIGALGAGQVLQLPIPIDRALISLRVDGQLVGRGHLVAVGDWLGVRLVGRGDPV
jgi:type III secretion protein Q